MVNLPLPTLIFLALLAWNAVKVLSVATGPAATLLLTLLLLRALESLTTKSFARTLLTLTFATMEYSRVLVTRLALLLPFVAKI